MNPPSASKPYFIRVRYRVNTSPNYQMPTTRKAWKLHLAMVQQSLKENYKAEAVYWNEAEQTETVL